MGGIIIFSDHAEHDWLTHAFPDPCLLNMMFLVFMFVNVWGQSIHRRISAPFVFFFNVSTSTSLSRLTSHLHFSPNSCIALHIHAITSTLGVFALDLRLHSAFQAPASH